MIIFFIRIIWKNGPDSYTITIAEKVWFWEWKWLEKFYFEMRNIWKTYQIPIPLI